MISLFMCVCVYICACTWSSDEGSKLQIYIWESTIFMVVYSVMRPTME
jgi:hypothetical protein